MDESKLLEKIRDVIFSVPDDIYSYSQPSECFDDDWKEGSPEEKAYFLVYDLLISHNRKKSQEKKAEISSVKEINLRKCPTFWSQADENMFFNSIYSIKSYIEIKGNGVELNLCYKEPMVKEEKDYLIGLLKRYQMEIPKELI